MTAPTLSERLREEARLIQYGERACVPGLLHEAAAEIERLTSQLEAAGLAKPAYHQPPYVDGYFGER